MYPVYMVIDGRRNVSRSENGLLRIACILHVQNKLDVEIHKT